MSTQEKKLSILNVQTIEEEIALIKEAEEAYDASKVMSAQEAYIKGLEFFNNLK